MVLNSEPDQAMEVYADLINTSPYLSDTVLSSSASKEEVLSNSMITDIMAANPQSAKNELILTALEERANPLTESMWSEVLGGIDTLGAREILESSLAGWIQLKEYCIANLIRIYLTDSPGQWDPDSCRMLLSNDHVLSSQFSLVSHLLDHDYNSSADSVLNAILYEYPLSSEEDSIREQFLTLNPILDVLLVDSIGNVLPDSIQQLVLEQLSLRNHTIPGTYARNILIASGLLNYTEQILTPSELKSSRRFRPQGKSEEFAGRFKVYPNPCRSFMAIEIIDKDFQMTYDIVVLSIMNKKVYKTDLSSLQNLFISMENFESGIYLIQLYQNGKLLETKQFIHIE